MASTTGLVAIDCGAVPTMPLFCAVSRLAHSIESGSQAAGCSPSLPLSHLVVSPVSTVCESTDCTWSRTHWSSMTGWVSVQRWAASRTGCAMLGVTATRSTTSPPLQPLASAAARRCRTPPSQVQAIQPSRISTTRPVMATGHLAIRRRTRVTSARCLAITSLSEAPRSLR